MTEIKYIFPKQLLHHGREFSHICLLYNERWIMIFLLRTGISARSFQSLPE